MALGGRGGTQIRSSIKAYRATSAQTINASTFTKIQCNGEAYDVLEEYDPITNYRYTAKRACRGLIIAAIYYNGYQTDRRFDVRVKLNNATYPISLECYFSTGAAQGRIAVGTVELAIDDYLELYTYHNCDVSKDVYYGEGMTYLIVHQIG